MDTGLKSPRLPEGNALDIGDAAFLWLSPLEMNGHRRLLDQRRQRLHSLNSPLLRARNVIRRTFSGGNQQEVEERGIYTAI